MNMYIFRPHIKWDYCGGSIIVIAENFNDCKKIIDASEFSNDNCYSFIKEDDDIIEYPYYDIWVLHEEFRLHPGLISRVVLCDFNYA